MPYETSPNNVPLIIGGFAGLFIGGLLYCAKGFEPDRIHTHASGHLLLISASVALSAGVLINPLTNNHGILDARLILAASPLLFSAILSIHNSTRQLDLKAPWISGVIAIVGTVLLIVSTPALLLGTGTPIGDIATSLMISAFFAVVITKITRRMHDECIRITPHLIHNNTLIFNTALVATLCLKGDLSQHASLSAVFFAIQALEHLFCCHGLGAMKSRSGTHPSSLWMLMSQLPIIFELYTLTSPCRARQKIQSTSHKGSHTKRTLVTTAAALTIMVLLIAANSAALAGMAIPGTMASDQESMTPSQDPLWSTIATATAGIGLLVTIASAIGSDIAAAYYKDPVKTHRGSTFSTRSTCTAALLGNPDSVSSYQGSATPSLPMSTHSVKSGRQSSTKTGT